MDDRRLCAQVVAEVKKAVVGKDEVVVKLLLAILARGHVLLEYIVRLVGATRRHPAIAQGAAPGPPWRWRR